MSRFDVSKFWPVPDDEFICGICMNVLDKPLETPCRHVFCAECIHKALMGQKKCPLCRKKCMKSNLKEVLPLVQNLINKLKMKCSNLHNGCLDFIQTEHYLDHLQVCKYSMVQCRFKDCSQQLLKRDLEEHETNLCSYREFLCNKGCGMLIPKTQLDSHVCIDALLLKVKDLQEENSKLQKILDETKSKVSDDKSSADSSHRNRRRFLESDYSSSDTDSLVSDTDSFSGNSRRPANSSSRLWNSDSLSSLSSTFNIGDSNSAIELDSSLTSETDERAVDENIISYFDQVEEQLPRPTEDEESYEINSSSPLVHQAFDNFLNEASPDLEATSKASNSVDNANPESSLNLTSKHVDTLPCNSGPPKEATCNNVVSPEKRPHDNDTSTQNKKTKQAKLATIYLRINAGRAGVCSVRATTSATDSLNKHESTTTTHQKNHMGHKKSKEDASVGASCSRENSSLPESTNNSSVAPHRSVEPCLTSEPDPHSSSEESKEEPTQQQVTQDSETGPGHADDFVNPPTVGPLTRPPVGPLTRRSARLQSRQRVLEDNLIPYVRVPPTAAYLLSKYGDDDSSDDASWSPSTDDG
ncbi:unnamed protein product [Lymnaea stagnalis]|uniref:Uncharacterized protein n=1 Tax=Lymnaea stagnalis TaxID=6523 RepID=A0AAV2I951_LYMST